MSTVSGLNAKGEKGKSKYVALDINSLYKGKSLENPKATVQPKHGLQSLGKVGAGRRMPPPANLPSLKSENSGNNPNISLVPSGGQGWGSATKEKGKTEESSGSQQQSPQLQPASSHSQATQKTQGTPNTAGTPGVSKTWSSVTSNQEDGGQERNFLGQQSPFFPQEFPKLAGGDAQTEGNQKSSADSQYGPGPSLRPQTEGSWGRGTLQQHQQQQQQLQPGLAGGPQQSSGSGVNGQPSSENQPLPTAQQHLRDQRPYPAASRGGPLPPNSAGSGASASGSGPTTPVLGPGPPGPGPGMGGQMGPGSALHPPPPQFRGMLPPYMYGRNNFPGGYPSNYSGMPPPPPQQTRQPYPYPENRRQQPVRPLAEEEAYQRPAAIITEKALKGFDEILQNDTQDTWAASHGEIDYNAKLVFSDDEETPPSQKKDKREEEEKGTRAYDCGKGDRERDLPERERDERNRDVEWGRDGGRIDKGSERDIDWDGERRDAFERDRDDRWKGWTQPPQGRPNPSLGMEMQRQWQSSQQQQRVPFDYRGPPPPPQPPGAPYAPPHMRLGPGPVPPQPQQHPGYPPPRPARPGPRPSSLTDDDELWRQRRKQHSDEMTMAVERARQRREEEEKRYEQSKQSAQEKAKSFEKNEKENKENLDIDDRDRSRHSSESRDEKPPSRDGRDRERERERERERSQANFQGFGFSRQFQKNVPPRFQKQAEYIRQQQQQQPSPPPAATAAAQQHFIRQQQQQQPASQGPPPPPPPVPPSGGNHGPPPPPLPMNMNYDPRWGTMPPPPYMNQMTGMSVMSKNMPRPRSSSQGSGTDSYESDRCTPDQNIPYERERDHYWNRERRQGMQSVTYDTWRAPSSTGGYYDQNTDCNSRGYDQRTDFKHSSDKDEQHTFDSHPQEVDRRDREFESQDYRYRGRESYEERPEQKQRDTVRDIRDRETKSDSWSNSREYEERMPDPFDEPSESNQPAKDRPERQERWDKERPPRPDSRDSRASRESAKEERHPVERQESQSSQSERERKSVNAREEKKEKSVSIDWGDTPYPMESKRREWHHHPPPITPKQFESLAPPKKNLTTLRRSTPSSGPSVSSDRKTEVQKDDGNKKVDIELAIKKEKEAKEEKNEKIKSETSAKESEKRLDEKPTQGSSDKLKATGQDNQKDNEGETKPETSNKEQTLSSEEKEKCGRENRPEMKDKHETSRNEQQSRDKRREGRDRGGINSRSRGGSAPAGGSGNNGGNIGRYDSSRGRGGRGSGFGGPGGFRGRSREYRRSRVERGPRFDRQKERDKDKVKEDKKEKHSDESSCSETEDGKLGHLRQKDEDSEVSVDEASASTTESAQAEKYQNIDPAQEEDKNVGISQNVTHKEEMSKSEKFQKDKRENSKRDSKLPYEFERSKEEKGGFAPRGEPSRRGRGGGGTMSFRNSRGGPRYGPSNYGPPPSKAAFGSGKIEKQEEQKCEDHISKDPAPGEHKDSIQHCDSTNNLFGKELNKSRSLERPQQRRPNRYEHLPPRLQKRQARRYDNFDHTTRGRGRGRSSGYQGTNNQVSNKINQGAKENLSDVANEEWETASESSDVAERRERRDEAKEEPKKKDSRDKGGSSASRKSFSSQRPMNEGTQGRKSGPESRRGGHGNPDRNRQRDGFGRENRGRDSGRGRASGSGNYGVGNGGTNNSERRLNNNGNNSRPSSSAGHNNTVGGRNSGRGGHPSSKTNPFPPKSEGTAAVYRVDEIKLQDPNSVQAALSDLTNRRSIKSEVAVNKTTKTEKEKSGGLEGYDLNNYASVVIIDDHPEVTGDDGAFLCDADDGFQEVTSKKRHKAMVDSDVKKMKKEPHSRNKSGSRSRQSRLPPRFAKQRETSQLNLTKSSVAAAATTNNSWDVSTEVSSANAKPSLQFPVKDASPAPPPSVNAWEKPITHSLRSHSPSLGQNCSANNTSNNVCSSNSNSTVNTSSSTTTAATDIQVLTTSSKSSSFDRSDQHDSGIDVSDQPASAASSQRSSPSNDCKILAPKNSVSAVKIPTSTETCPELVTDIDSSKPMCTVVFENKNFKAENAVLDKFGGQSKNQPVKEITTSTSTSLAAVGSGLAKSKESEIEDTKAIRLPVTFSTKEPFGKGEEGTDMKLDFTFDSELAQLTEEKTVSSSSSNSNNTGSTSTKAMNMGHSMQVTSVSTTVGVQSPISPSADELNLKIASVKKVWESIPPMPTVLEHPQTVSVNVTEESSCPTSFGSFSGNSDPSANSYNTSVDAGPQSRKDSAVDSSEMAFRDSSPLQQSNNSSGLVTKTVDHNTVCAVKSQQVQLPQHGQMTGPHCTGPVSPPLIGGLDTAMTGIRTIAGLASSVQVAGIPAIPSPPTVLFNSSQQMAQTGLYQPLQMDSSQVLSRQSQAAAVAAAMAQFTQPPHGYAPLGTYGLSHQPPSAQLSSAFGQQSLFVQPPTAHQAQDIYPSNQFRVQPPYPQSQHVTSSQVLSAQQNLASSHLLGSQLVQTRPTAGPTAAGPHLQGLHSLQHVQPGPPTSYYSSSAQAQTAASFYHQPPTTPGSPMQQQPQFPSHQGYGSQSALNVLPQAAAVTQNFRNFGSHQFKAATAVMNNMVPESSTSLRSATRSPTMDASSSRNVFGVGNTTTTTMNSGSVMAVPQISSPGVVGKVGQPPQANTSGSARMGTSSANKGSQYALPQSQQHYYPFGQQKFGHVQSPAVRPQVMFPGVVRNNPHQAQHAAAAATNIHYPAPIQRPGSHTSVTQPTPQQPAKVGNRSQVSLMVPGGKLTSAQQAKLRAEAVQQTHMFFAQTKTGKPDDAVASILAQEKNGLSTTTASKLSVTSSVSEESKDKTGKVDSSLSLSPVSDTNPVDGKEIKESELPAVEE